MNEKPDHVGHFERGQTLADWGHLEAAIVEYSKSIELKRDFAIAFIGRGHALAGLGRQNEANAKFPAVPGRFEEAVADYTEAIRLAPESTDAFYNRGLAWDDLGRYEEAIEDYTDAIRLDADHFAAYFKRGHLFRFIDMYGEAVRDFTVAIRIQPQHAVTFVGRGQSLAALGRHEEAIIDFTAAIRIKPDDADVYRERGVLLGRLGRVEAAVADCTEAIRRNPQDHLAYAIRGVYQGTLGRSAAALSDYSECIRLRPDSVLVYAYRAELKRGEGDFLGAAEDYSTAVELEPNHESAAAFRASRNECLLFTQVGIPLGPPPAIPSGFDVPATTEHSGFLLRFSALFDTPPTTFADLYVSPLPSVPPRKPGEYDDGQDFPDAMLARFAAEPGKAKAIAKLLGLDTWAPADEERFAWHSGSTEAAAAVMAAAERHGVTMEWEHVLSRAKQNATKLAASNLSINAVTSATTKMNWFGVQGHVEVAGERISLLDLVRASRAGKKFVVFPSGLCGEISDDLAAVLERLATWLNPDGAADEAIRIPGLAGLSLLSSDDDALGKVDWGELADTIRRAYDEPVTPFSTHGHLKLSAYQHVGHEWLVRLSRWAPGACLADDMGLGKTRQVLALLMSRNTGPALVVAPASVCNTWLTFDGVKLPADVLSSHAFDGHQGGKHKPGAGQVLVTSYDFAVRHIDELGKTHWSTIVFDEGHALKNRLAARTLQLAKLQADFRVIVTGTPLENNLAELWSISQFFAPSLFGTAAEFENRFRRPIEAGDDGRAKVLVELLEPFIQRRLMHEVADGLKLPGLTEVEHNVTLSPAERSHYEARRLLAEKSVREALKTVSEARKRIHTIDLLRQLRAIAVGIDLPMTMTTAGVKITELCRLVLADKARGEKVLVFSQWTTALELVGQAFKERGIIFDQFDGSLSVRKRTDLQERFQAGNLDALLLTLGAGGVGINLWAATRVYLLDPWWNPHREKQAICRAYRRGQTLPVVAVRLIAADTVEVQVRELQKQKEALFDKVIRGSAGRTQLTTAELIALVTGKG